MESTLLFALVQLRSIRRDLTALLEDAEARIRQDAAPARPQSVALRSAESGPKAATPAHQLMR